MAWLDRLLGDKRSRRKLEPLYAAIVARGRDPEWYRRGGVPDTKDGRFDMIAAIMALVLIRLEAEGRAHAGETALLAEVFIEDMDAQLREEGVGDVVVGKHVGKMMGAIGGRLSAYREGFADGGDARGALARNLYRGDTPDGDGLDYAADRLRSFRSALDSMEPGAILAGEVPAL